jgi:acyl-CoA thioesterase II
VPSPTADRAAEGDPISLEELTGALTAVRAGGDRFWAESPDWWAGDRVFGGVATAQAFSAACQTVAAPLHPHSLHGYFLRPAAPSRSPRIEVARVRDGRTFSVRQVTTTIDGKATFVMLCSFHAGEAGDEYQLPMPPAPGPGSAAPVALPQPIELRELGPTPRQPDGTYRSTRRVWLRTTGRLGDDPGLHACVAAYLSDMTGAAYRPHSLGTWGTHTDASLDHAMWFHRPVRCDEWLLYDLQALVNAGGRSTLRGTLHDRRGVLRMSMAQELLIRPLEHPRPGPRPLWAEKDGGTRVDPTQL